MLTGQYPDNHGVRTNQQPSGGYVEMKNTIGNTLPVWLQQAGYYTAHIGKFLNGYGTGRTPPTPRCRRAGASGTDRSTTPTPSPAAPTRCTATR